ncbi:MAG: hypothetical protein HN416_17090 [Nitrospina sp.]|jgi:hypothetical protein|nr:hypothetical protein [Nitrospina sp.]
MNIQSRYDALLEILRSRSATLKLLIIRNGISVDGEEMEREIKGYPERFRTKRRHKNTALVDGFLVDAESGYVPFVPEEIFIEVDGRESIVKLNVNENSPFRITNTHGKWVVHCNELDLTIPIRLSVRNAIREITINERPGDEYIQVLGQDRVAVLGYEGCSGWFYGTQCKFCDACASRPQEKSARPSLNDLKGRFDNNVEKWLGEVEAPYTNGVTQAYDKVMKDPTVGPHKHIHLMAGNMDDVESEWHYMLRLSAAMNEVHSLADHDSYLNLIPPKEANFLELSKKTGFRNIQFNMEVYGENYYKSICPDKHSKIPFNMFLNRLRESAEIFGKGYVRCGFVFGVQPDEILKKGIRELAKMGVVSDYTIFTPKRGTPWENLKRPDEIQVANFARWLGNIYDDYGFSPLYCSMSSRSCIMNELGVSHGRTAS